MMFWKLPGKNPINNHFQCSNYNFASRNYPNDGLSSLRNVTANLVVVSFGVIDSDVLRTHYERGNKCLFDGYVEELALEIKKVSTPFAIICGNSAEKYLGKPNIPALATFPSFGGIYL